MFNKKYAKVMKVITEKAQKEVLNAIKLMERGDRIEFDGLSLFIYNAQGCLIDSIKCYVH